MPGEVTTRSRTPVRTGFREGHLVIALEGAPQVGGDVTLAGAQIGDQATPPHCDDDDGPRRDALVDETLERDRGINGASALNISAIDVKCRLAPRAGASYRDRPSRRDRGERFQHPHVGLADTGRPSIAECR